MKFNEKANLVLNEIQKVSAMYLKEEVTDDIVLYALYRINQHEPLGKIMYASDMSIFMLRKALDNEYDMEDQPYGQRNEDDVDIPYSQQTEILFKDAESYTKLTNHEEISSIHILLALLNSENEIVKEYLEEEVDIPKLQKELIALMYGNVGDKNKKDSKNDNVEKKMPKILKDSCEDLTQQAINGEIDPIIGRHKEVDMIINTLSRRTKNNVLIVGPAGAGKTALVKGLTLRILNGEVPALVNKRVFSLNLGALMGGTTYRGQLEEKCANLVKALTEMEDIILFIDEMHTLMSAGASSGNDKVSVAGLLKPALTSRKLQIIGCTTEKEVRVIQEDPAFIRRFNIINLDEPDDLETLEILKGLAYKYEEFHDVTIPEETLKAAVRLSSRYITERYQPDKSIDVIDEAAAKLKLRNRDQITLELQLKTDIETLLTKIDYAEDFNDLINLHNELDSKEKELQAIEDEKADEELRKAKRPILTPDDIALIVEDRTKIPVAKLMSSDKQKLLRLEEELHKKIIGQDLAVKAVSDAVRKNSSGIGNPNKPIASFMFAGPTGTGKTELCKALADIQFGSRDNIIRIDCSEFAEQIAVNKLIGSAPGLTSLLNSNIIIAQVKLP